MKHFFRHFLYYSRRQQQGILTLVVVISAVWLFPAGYRHLASLCCGEEECEGQHRSAAQEATAFLSSIQRSPAVRRSRPAATGHAADTPASREAGTLFPFDPNRADSLTFRRLGLPGWMAHNILKYREKGGRFRQKEEFRKIYGLTDEQFATLSPYIQILPQPTAQPAARPSLLVQTADSLSRVFPEKYPAGTVIELNSADTTELQKIPGIGSGIARQITHYRQQLGGFYRIEQLEEIQLRYQLLIPWFRIDTTLVRRIPVNRASVERLSRHPYINFYQARALVEHRRKTGPIHHLKPFVLLEEFTPKDLQRIAPYLDFSVSQTAGQPHTDTLPRKGR